MIASQVHLAIFVLPLGKGAYGPELGWPPRLLFLSYLMSSPLVRLRQGYDGGPQPGGPHSKEESMRFMLLMNAPRDGYDQYLSWPKAILEANMAFMGGMARKLAASGELVGTEALASPMQAKRVRAGSGGKPITDGVFPELKEFLAGYWLVDVESPERAYEIAADVSTAPGGPVTGADGKPVEHFWIEVRQVMSGAEDLR